MTVFRAIPPPGSTIQSLSTAIQAITQTVNQLTGELGDGTRQVALKDQLQVKITGLDTRLSAIEARLKAAGIA